MITDTTFNMFYVIPGFPPDQSDPVTKATALHIAVESGNLRAIQLLIQAGAQVNVCDLSLSTPLHIAAYSGYEEVRLFYEIKSKNRNIVSLLLDYRLYKYFCYMVLMYLSKIIPVEIHFI
jgi:ankyrin repeat protein